jgi:restriction system protein
LFEDFKSHALVAIGWSEMGDMAALKTREDFVKAVAKTWPEAKRTQVAMSENT